MKFLISVLVCALAASAALNAQEHRVGGYAPDEILVKFVKNRPAQLSEAANRGIGAVKIEDLGSTLWQRIRVPAGMTVDEAIERYKQLEGVEYVQPNYYYHPLMTPNDPQYASLYGLAKISAPNAWELTTGSSTVVVADIDSGIRYTHEDLAANMYVNPGEIQGNGVDDDGNGFVDDYSGWDFRFNDANPIDIDGSSSSSHGTHTAGTIGAVGNNAVGVVGVNWNVKILNIKIFNNQVDDDTTSAMLVNAYNYIRMMKNRGVNIRVTNNSYGGCTEACGYDQATKDALDALGDAGVLNVFSAGNSNSNNDTNPQYPASYTSPSVMSVAASDANDAKASFSSYGLTSVDLAAPGSSIMSTVAPNGYASFSGTSMAAPHVAGAAALLSAYNPSLSVASLKATLINNVDALTQWNSIVRAGGRLNVDKALRNQTICTFNAGASTVTVPTKGGVFTLNVSAGNSCDYAAKTNDHWISLVDNAPKSGNGTVTFRVTVNRAITRIGTLKIGDQTITIRQSRV